MECAFCGQTSASPLQRVLCHPCQAPHEVCHTCADEATADRDLEVDLLAPLV